MTIKVTLWEMDDTHGYPDSVQRRDYHIATVDTVPHAMRLAVEQQRILANLYTPETARYLHVRTVNGFDRFTFKLTGREHRDAPGDVWRTTWVSVSKDD